MATVTYSADGGWTERLSFAELDHAVDSIAAGLIELGVQLGDPVCFQLPNWWQFTAIHLACSRIGAISCPIVPILRRREVEYILKVLRARVFILPRSFRGHDTAALGAAVLAAVDTLEHVFTVEGRAVLVARSSGTSSIAPRRRFPATSWPSEPRATSRQPSSSLPARQGSRRG